MSYLVRKSNYHFFDATIYIVRDDQPTDFGMTSYRDILKCYKGRAFERRDVTELARQMAGFEQIDHAEYLILDGYRFVGLVYVKEEVYAYVPNFEECVQWMELPEYFMNQDMLTMLEGMINSGNYHINP